MGWIIDLADGGGGSANQRVIVPPDSPFANAAAVAAFYIKQPNRNTWLRNSTEESIDGAVLTVIVVDDNTGFPDANSGVNTYQWGGIDQAGSYNITDWVIYQGLNAAEIKELLESNPDTNTVTDEEKGFLETTREYGGNNYLLSGSPKVESTGLRLGDVVNIRDYGNLLGVEYSTDTPPNNFVRIPDYVSPSNADAGKVRRFKTSSSNQSVTIRSASSPPTDTGSTLTDISFNFTLNNSNLIEGSLGRTFVFTATSVINNFRFRLSKGLEVLKYWPSEESWIDGSNTIVIPAGELTVDFNNSPYFAFNDTYTIDMEFDAGGTFLSSLSAVNIPACNANFQLGKYVFSQDEIVQTDISGNTTAEINTSYNIDISSGDITVTLPTGVSNGDVVRIGSLSNSSPPNTNTLTVDGVSNNSISLVTANGTIVRDQTVTTTQSIPFDIVWNNGWFIYNFRG